MFLVSLSMMSSGFVTSWAGPALHVLTTSPEAPFKLPANQTSSIASIFSPGSLIGALAAYHLANKWSRSKLITVNAIIYLASSIIYTIWESLYPYYLARTLSGIAVGVSYGVVPLYICEISSPKIRGALCFILSVAIGIGSILTYYLIPYFSLKTFNLVCCGVAVVQFFLCLCLPESPYLLLIYNDRDGAREALQQIRNKKDVSDEILELKNYVLEQSELPKVSFKKFLSDVKYRRAILLSCLTILVQQNSGNFAIQSYSATIFDAALLPFSSDLAGVIYQTIGVTSLLISGSLIDIFGRRTLFLFSSLTVLVSLLTLDCYYFLQYWDVLEVGVYPFIPLTFMVIHIAGCSVGLIPLPIVISNELMPVLVRPLAGLLITFTNCFGSTLALVAFHVLSEVIGLFAPMFFYTVLMCIFGTLVLIYLPETKGKTLEEIQCEK